MPNKPHSAYDAIYHTYISLVTFVIVIKEIKHNTYTCIMYIQSMTICLIWSDLIYLHGMATIAAFNPRCSNVETHCSKTLNVLPWTWSPSPNYLGTHPWATRKRTSKDNICRPAEEDWHNHNRGAGSHDERPQDLAKNSGFSTPIEKVST